MGKRSLYVYIRQYQYNIARAPLWKIYQKFHAVSIKQHKNKIHRCRGSWIVPGPNHSWCIDNYCKLSQYRFDVYAGIDVYSRFILWFYVGVSANTAYNALA